MVLLINNPFTLFKSSTYFDIIQLINYVISIFEVTKQLCIILKDGMSSKMCCICRDVLEVDVEHWNVDVIVQTRVSVLPLISKYRQAG